MTTAIELIIFSFRNAASPEIASNTAFWNIDHERYSYFFHDIRLSLDVVLNIVLVLRDADYVFNNMQLGPSRSFEHSIDSSQSSDEMEMTACSGFIRTSPFKAEVMPENDVIEFDRVPCFNYTQNVGKQLPDIPKTVLFEGGDDMEFTHVDNFTIQVGNEYHSKYCDSQSLESQNCSTSDDQHSSTNPAKSLNNSKNAYDDGVCVENTSTIKGSPHVADGNQACIQPDICNEQLIDEMEMKEGENCEISASYNTRKRKNCEDDDNSMITDSALYYKSKICPTDSEDICGIQRQPRIHLLTSTSQLENFVDVKHSNDFGNAQMTKRLHNQTDNNDEGYLEHELRSNTSSSRFNVSVVSALSQDVPTSNRNISKCSSMNSVEKPRDDSIAQIGAGAKKQSSMNVVNETRNNDPIAEPCRDINDSIHESNVNNTLFDSDSQDQLSTVEKVIDSNDRLGDVPAKSQDLLFKEEYLTKYQSSKLTSAICEKSKHMGDESWKSPLALTVQLSTECVDHGSASNLPEEALIIGEKFISKNTESLSLQTPTKEEFSPIKQMTENNDVDVSIADSMTSVKQDPIVDNEGAKPSSWAIDKTKWNLQSKDFEASFQRSDHATASSKEIHQAAANEHYLTITTHLTNSINHDWPKEGDERSAVPSHPENSHQDEALERIDDVPMPHCVEMWCSSKDNDSNFVEKPSILMKVSHDVKVSNVNENIEVDANEAASLLRVQSSEVVHRRSIRRETVVLSKVVHHSVTELSVKEDSEVLAHKSIEPKNNSRQEIETRKPKGGRLCRRLTYLISSKPPVSLDDLSINLGQTDVEPIIHNKSLDKKLIDIAKQNVAQETRDSIVPISSFTSPKEDYAELSVRSSSSAQKLYHKETSLSSKTERHKRPNKQPQEEANFATSRTPWPSLQLRLNKLSKEILDASFAPPRQNGKDHCSKVGAHKCPILTFEETPSFCH